MQLSELPYDDSFVANLPGDPRRDPGTRTVSRACWSHAEPTPVSAPRIVHVSAPVAALLGLDPTATDELASVLAGNRVLPGMRPFAACYGGHQFGSWAGQLGDGRAITLAEVKGPAGRYEIQLKGAGPTAYSRRGDGRAVLRSSLREYVCSEAMAWLGVPTTRALALVLTGDDVTRDMLYDGNAKPEPGAIVCRVAPTFVRFGSFEIHAARGDETTLRALVDHTIRTWYPGMDVAGFFEAVGERTVDMVVHWQRVGFVHGVMNTDNMSVLGLTIDYGPYGWLEPYDPDWTPNTTDASGRRYRFGNQPAVVMWNLVRFAHALAPLVDDVAPLEAALTRLDARLARSLRRGMLDKLGLVPADDTPEGARGDAAMVLALQEAFTHLEVDMTLFFRALAAMPTTADVAPSERVAAVRGAFYSDVDASGPAVDALATWLDTYAARVRAEGRDHVSRRRGMDAVNPAFVPRNWVVQEVIDAVERGDDEPLRMLMGALERPYDEATESARWRTKRPEWARHRAGCSMLSCSS
ncbi:MAG: YdiU family protein [Polyangiaceae bacterium]